MFPKAAKTYSLQFDDCKHGLCSLTSHSSGDQRSKEGSQAAVPFWRLGKEFFLASELLVAPFLWLYPYHLCLHLHMSFSCHVSLHRCLSLNLDSTKIIQNNLISRFLIISLKTPLFVQIRPQWCVSGAGHRHIFLWDSTSTYELSLESHHLRGPWYSKGICSRNA